MLTIEDNTNIFRTTFNNSVFGMAILSIEGRFLAVNKQLSSLLGYAVEEFLKLNYEDITYPDDIKIDEEKLGMLLSGEITNYKLEKRYIHKYGNIIWAVIGVYVVKDDNGKPLHLISQIIDRTAPKNKELEILETKNILQKIMDESFDIICTMDFEGICLQINKASKHVFGYTPAELIGTRLMNYVYPDDLERTALVGEAIREGHPETYFENRFIKKDGSIVPLRWSVNANLSQKTLFCIGQDVTELKKADQKLIALNAEIKAWANQLEISNSHLEEFAYVASHDLQEPLRMVAGFLQLLENKVNDKFDDIERGYLHYALDGSKRMQKMLMGLLEYSKVSQENNQFEDVDLNDILNDTIEVLKFNMQRSGTKLLFYQLPVIKGNKTMLSQLFQNLFSNSIKYRRPDDYPIINVTAESIENSWHISVTDNGIGMDSKYLKKIFILFQRLHSKTEYSGSGIGLSICKRIIEKHQGTIWAESEPGKGSTFFFSLPKNL